MKKVFILSAHIISLFFLFCSCSNNSDLKTNSGVYETLREEAENMNSYVLWTEEIEKDRLAAKFSVVPGISNRVKLSTLSITAKSVKDDEKIYPVLEGFASLDVSLIPSGLKTLIQNFFNNVNENSPADSLFNSESLYLLGLFNYDMNQLIPDYELYFQKAQEEQEKKAEEERKKAETAEKSSAAGNSSLSGDGKKQPESSKEETEKTASKAAPYFKKCILGEPFLDGKNYDVPVRFSNDTVNLDLRIYAASKDSEWKIDQVSILAVENRK